jgi:two-component system, NarL family, response regulator
MASVASRVRSDGQLGHGALSIASIASSASAAGAVLVDLADDELMVEGRHLGSGPAAVEKLAHGTDVVLIMDDQAQRAGDIVHAVRHKLPDAGIVVVLPAATRSDTRVLLAAGADALVLERDGEGVLSAAVQSVSLGQISVPRPFRDCLDRPALSHRQRQIIALVAAGSTNAQIAQRLCLSESTIKGHLSSAFRQLGVSSRRKAAAAVFAFDAEFRRSILSSVGPIDP